eukprot:1924469-Pyramimonas_sp.AAC.1
MEIFILVPLNPLRSYHAASFVEKNLQFHGINRHGGVEFPSFSPFVLSCQSETVSTVLRFPARSLKNPTSNSNGLTASGASLRARRPMPGPDVPALRMVSRSGFAGSGAGSETESETLP